MIILDTNVVSEPSQPRPSSAVMEWLAQQDASQLFTTTATEAELYYGLALMPAGRRRDELEKALRRFLGVELDDRVLPFDRAAAMQFGAITAARREAGLQIKVFDSQIAAIARVHGAAVATRDVGDFEHSGVEIINPWNG
ncbi:MAG TPA: type II toxin-antitoxin system VapC family toxin [Rhizomicrobium sp.]|nr:type II toxin-antitoxin system VapC family toxin [Rhizomicrobium sp.]